MCGRWAAAAAVAATAALGASAEEIGAPVRELRGLDFMECDGEGFDPRWAAFRARLPRSLVPGVRIGDGLADEASGILDLIEEQNIPRGVAAFGMRLRGEEGAEEALEGFCLYGAITAYVVIALHLGAGSEDMQSTAKNSLGRAILLLAKKQVNDFLESSSWPLRSLDAVAMLELQDYKEVRSLGEKFRLPCYLTLGCAATLRRVEALSMRPPEPPLDAAWPSRVAAVGIHATSTLEAVSALRDAMAEAWGRGGAGGTAFKVQYAGHPCPSHSGSEHQCAMRCELLGICGAEADAADPLAEFLAGAVDMARYEERESYSLAEARAALRWAPRRLEPLRTAELFLCTFPTVLCVLLHELFPDTPLLFVAIANPLFAAPGCVKKEDSTVRECDTEEAQEYLVALRDMLTTPNTPVRGIAAYTVTVALVGYQAGVVLPLAGKAARYLPAEATWRGADSSQVLVARSRFLETSFGAAFRAMVNEFRDVSQNPVEVVLQQEAGSYLSYEALSAFRAVLIFPQDLGLHKFTEHYAMGMPIWVPCRELVYRLQMFVPWGMVAYSGSWRNPGAPATVSSEEDRPKLRPPRDASSEGEPPRLVYPPFFNSQTVPFPLAETSYWYEFGEFVSYPGVQEFCSIPELLEDLRQANLEEIAAQMRRHRAELWRSTRAVYAAAASELAQSAAAAFLARASTDAGQHAE